jgi:hypothetical protein
MLLEAAMMVQMSASCQCLHQHNPEIPTVASEIKRLEYSPKIFRRR